MPFRLTTNDLAQETAPAWSPDGKRIAFQTDPTATSCGIHIADVGGSGNVFDFTGPGYGTPCITPSWSPDGKKLAWEELVSGGGIMVMTANVDGTGGYNGLTFGAPFVDRWPVWASR